METEYDNDLMYFDEEYDDEEEIPAKSNASRAFKAIVAIIVALAFALAAPLASIFGASTGSNNMLSSIASDIAYADELDDTRAAIDDVEAQIQELQEQIAHASEEYNSANIAYETALADLEAKTAEIEATQASIDELSERIGTRSIQLYKNDLLSIAAVMLGAQDMGDFIDVLNMLVKLNDDDAAVREKLSNEKEALAREQSELAEIETAAAQALEQARVLSEGLEAQQDELQSQLDDLSDQEREILAERGIVAGTSSVDVPTNTYGSAVLEAAYKYYGLPYQYGGSGPSAYDCSGFVQRVLADVGIYVSHQSEAIKNEGYQIPVSEAQPGDVLWYSGHVGICISVDGNTVTYCDSQNYGTVIQTRTSSISSWSCAVRF